MRVAVVTESFLPHVNGVTNSVLRVLEHLRSQGHQAMVVTPTRGDLAEYAGAPVVRLTGLPMPGYPEVTISLSGTRRLRNELRTFSPDVIHLASPFAVGPPCLRAAARLDVPVVSIFQTDVAGFATHYGMSVAGDWAWRRLGRIHGAAERTLAPSTASMKMLADHGIPRLALWPRGVDSRRFDPVHRSAALRAELGGEVLVGYVGRLAAEKEVGQLAALADLPGVRLVIIGEGPMRAELEVMLPRAAFLGFLGGEHLSRAIASLDVMVHPGRHETFGQTIQEALASGVPVVACASGGPLDLIRSSHNGWLYEPGDTDALRDRVRDLVGDETKRHAMGMAARESVAHRTWDRVCASLVGHYRSAVGLADSLSEVA